MEDSLNNSIYLKEDSTITLKEFMKVARQDFKVHVNDNILQKIQDEHQVIHNHIKRNTKDSYGLTTGLGSQKNITMDQDILSDFNESIILDHSISIGKQASRDIVRGTMFIRLAAFSKGGSGVSLRTFNSLLDVMNAGITPRAFESGSVGQADLGQLSQISLVLIGEGEAWYDNQLMSGKSALKKANIEPVNLQPRDALALIGTNSFSAAIAGLSVLDAQKYNNWSEIAIALSSLAFGVNTDALREDVLKLYSPEAESIGERIRNILSNADFSYRSIQDPLSFRCIPQIHGYLTKSLKDVELSVLSKIKQPLDNPFLNVDTDELISNGNFDATDLALECDRLRSILYRVILLIERRAGKLLTNHFSNYPTGLSTKPGYTGIGVLHHLLLALTAEASSLAQATLVQPGEAAEGVEDYGSMASQSVQHLERIVEIWHHAIAVEIVIAVHALKFSDISMNNKLNNLFQKINSILTSAKTPSKMVDEVSKFMITNDGIL